MLTLSARGELFLARAVDFGLDRIVGTPVEGRAALFERLVLETQRSLDHFDRQFGGLQVAKLVLSRSPVADDLQRAFADGLYVPVETLDLDRIMDLDAAAALRDPATQGSHLAVLGASLRSS